MKFFYYPLLLFVFANGYTQNCNCDVTLTGLSSTSLNLIWASQVSYQPGDVICIPGGNYAGIRFYDFQGTENAPLTIKNCNGEVVIDESGYSGIEFRNSKFIHFTGTGDANYEYGFRVAGTSSWAMGISLGNFSTDFEVDHVGVDSAGFAGLMAKTDPVCDNPATWRSNGFVMKNLNIHHNYFKNTGGEGIYIGFSLGYKRDIGRTCNGTPIYGHWLEHVHVHHNTLENIGWDGIQLNLVHIDGKVHDNTIYNYGTEDRYAQDFAMSIGGGVYEVYNNVTENGPQELGQGLQFINAQSGTKIFNNVIIRPKLHGIFTHARHEFDDQDEGYYIANNTIIEPEKAGVHYNTTLINPINPADLHKPQDTVPSFFVNNLVVDPGYNFENGNTWKQNQESYFDFNEKSTRDNLLVNIYTNIMTRQIDTLGLTDIINDDYRPLSTSSGVVDQGSDVSNWGITFDLDTNLRPSGGAFDIGAFEFDQATQQQAQTIGGINLIENNPFVYPNPASSHFQINLKNQDEVYIELYSGSGEKVYQKKYKQGEKLPVEGYKSGMYYLNILDPNKKEFNSVEVYVTN